MKTLALHELGLPANLPLPQRRDWRVGVIGLGGIAQAHLPAYRRAGWTVVAAADLDATRRERAGKEFEIETLRDDFHAVIEDPRVEVVSLLTQPNVREDVVAACARARKPLLTEKPFGLDLAACERMVRTAADAGIALAVSQNYRWLPAVFAARNLIAAGRIGRPFYVSIELHGAQDRDLANHPFYSQCADFLTVQWNSHLADLVRSLMQRDPRRVLARTSRMPGQAFVSDNVLVSLMDFDRDGTGLIVHNENHRGHLAGNQVRIEGDAGAIVFQLWGSTLTLSNREFGAEPVTIDCAPAGLLDSFCGPMADLLISLEEHREPLTSGRLNLATVRQILAEQASAAEGSTWHELERAT